jgi:ribonuclease HII
MPRAWITVGLPEPLLRLNDSKKLNEKVREKLFEVIDSDKSIEWGIGVVDTPLIDEINILQATHQAMNDALAKITPPVQHALVDGRQVPGLSVPQTAIVKGDGKSYSIGAASILAKVTRDRLMVEYDQKYPGYGFAGHKGYGTKAHLSAIEELGPCPIHRMSFAPLSNTQTELLI